MTKQLSRAGALLVLASCASGTSSSGPGVASGPPSSVAAASPSGKPAAASPTRGTAAAGATVPSARATTATKGNSNLIVAAEIASSGVSDAFQAVKLLRPTMLRGRNGSLNDNSGGAEIVVYVDGVRSGGPQTLEAVTALAVMEIRYINAADATTRFGTGHPLGAIVVLTKR